MRTILLILSLTLSLLAQEAQELTTLKGVVKKGRAPISSEVLRVKLPAATETRLKNGLAVLVLEDHRAPTVSIEISIPASTLADPDDLSGLADATADMLRLGTKTRNSRQLVEALAELGASLTTSAASASRYTRVNVSTLIENLDPVLELLADVLLQPAFPQEELDKWRARQLSGLQQARTQPSFLANERLFQILYPDDARRITNATPESLNKLTRQNLIDFYGSHYTPVGSVAGVAGDVTSKLVTEKLEKYLGAWKGSAVQSPNLPLAPPIAKGKIVLIHRPGSVQTYLMAANRAIGRASPDYYACTVMNRVLGQGPAARLFRNLREEKGFTYSIGSSFTATRYLNYFSASTSVRTEVTGPALEELLKEFKDIATRPVPTEELEGAKRALVAGFALGLESSSGLLTQILTRREYGFPPDYWDRYPENLMKVTAADVQRVAASYVPSANAQIIAVGDAGKIAEVLGKFGEVEQFNAEGERIPAPK